MYECFVLLTWTAGRTIVPPTTICCCAKTKRYSGMNKSLFTLKNHCFGSNFIPSRNSLESFNFRTLCRYHWTALCHVHCQGSYRIFLSSSRVLFHWFLACVLCQRGSEDTSCCASNRLCHVEGLRNISRFNISTPLSPVYVSVEVFWWATLSSRNAESMRG